MKLLITGCAGFIGFHLCKSLISKKFLTVGIDNLNNYYDVQLKRDRLNYLIKKSKKNKLLFKFRKIDISDPKKINKLFASEKFTHIINLAAQAGVKYSLTNPRQYIKSNISGFLNLLEACRYNKIKHFIYASSSSVYGGNTKLPFEEKDSVDHPLQLYATTKRSNELMAHCYSHLFNIPTTGLRFFTVYGPWGRPDMAIFKFTKNIINNNTIFLHNNGNHERDFTYINDVIKILKKIYKIIPKKSKNSKKYFLNPSISNSSFRIYNIGNNSRIKLKNIIKYIEKELKMKAIKKNLPRQKEDILKTHANSQNILKTTGGHYKTDIKIGIKKFIEWYRGYYQVNR